MRSVNLTINTKLGGQYPVSDAQNPNAGSIALTQLAEDSMIHTMVTMEGTTGEVYVPFHAIAYVTVSHSDDATAPVDALCETSTQDSTNGSSTDSSH